MLLEPRLPSKARRIHNQKLSAQSNSQIPETTRFLKQSYQNSSSDSLSVVAVHEGAMQWPQHSPENLYQLRLASSAAMLCCAVPRQLKAGGNRSRQLRRDRQPPQRSTQAAHEGKKCFLPCRPHHSNLQHTLKLLDFKTMLIVQ